MISLRPYQERAVEAAQQLFREGERRILLQLPTGGGKTVIAARILSGAVAKGRRVLFMAPRREIIAQSYAKLHADGVPLEQMGVIMGDGVIPHPVTGKAFKATNPNALAQVASDQTLRNRAKPPAEVVFVDEAHHAVADKQRAILRHYTDRGAVVIGLSATPVRNDNQGLKDIFDRIIIVESMSGLIEGGYLCRPRTFAGPRPDLAKVKVTAGEYQLNQLSEAMRGKGVMGNILETWSRHHAGRSTVVFAVDVLHSLEIVRRFREAGATAEHLDGATPEHERDAILRRFAAGETQVLSNCQVLTEGWDCPRASVCVLARPTKSLALYLQMVGRVLRPWNDTPKTVLDHAGNVFAFGLADEDRSWSLEHTRITNGEVPERECPSCECVNHLGARNCVECGHMLWDPEERKVEKEIELVEVSKQPPPPDVIAAPPPPPTKLTVSPSAEEQREMAEREALRKELGRSVGRLCGKVAREYNVVAADLFSEANRAVYRYLGRSRSLASSKKLSEAIAWLDSGRGAEIVRETITAVAEGLTPISQRKPAPTAPQPPEPPRQRGLFGDDPAAGATSMKDLPRKAPERAQEAKKGPAPLDPRTASAMDRALAAWRAEHPNDDDDFPT